jgi:hypothetical protein
MSTKIELDTTEYRQSHLREPRGRGAWAFYVGDDLEPLWSPSMTYTEAKRWLREQLKNRVLPGGVVVRVGS